MKRKVVDIVALFIISVSLILSPLSYASMHLSVEHATSSMSSQKDCHKQQNNSKESCCSKTSKHECTQGGCSDCGSCNFGAGLVSMGAVTQHVSKNLKAHFLNVSFKPDALNVDLPPPKLI